MDTHDLQQQYWNQLVRLKRDALYVSFYHEQIESIERYLNIFAAGASLGAVTAWAAVHSLAEVWGVVILASQLLVAVRPYLPYRARLKALSGLGPDLDALALLAETEWFKVARLALDDVEIYKRTMTLKRKALDAQGRNFRGMSLPQNRALDRRAEAATDDYMRLYVVQDSAREIADASHTD